MAWATAGSLQCRLAARRAACAVALALAVLGAAPAAWAEAGLEGGWLRWQGPLECQNTREVERQIESLLGRPPGPSQLPATRVEVGWDKERRWTLRISVALPQGERRRDVDVRTCADGFDVVALTLALILDPDLQADLGDALSDVDVAVGGPSASAAEPPPAVATPLFAAVTKPPPEPEPAPDRLSTLAEPLQPRASGPAVSLVGSGRADLGSLPATLYGGGLELSLRADGWRLEGGGALLLHGSSSLPAARYRVSYSNFLGLLRGCHEFSAERGGHFGLCLGGQLGSLGASEQGGLQRSPRGLWAAAALGAELALEISERWQGFSRVELVFPLVRHELELAGGPVVYELPQISVQLTVGAAVELTEWGGQ